MGVGEVKVEYASHARVRWGFTEQDGGPFPPEVVVSVTKDGQPFIVRARGCVDIVLVNPDYLEEWAQAHIDPETIYPVTTEASQTPSPTPQEPSNPTQ